MTDKEKIDELEERIKRLEQRPVYIPVQYTPPTNITPWANVHYHGQIPCYQNPCVWC